MSDLERFKSLFRGREDAYGQYARPSEELGGDKRLGDRFTAIVGRGGHEPLNDKHWQAHLAGEMGLGITPVQLDGTVGFFVFDVDKYGVGSELHVKLQKRIDKIGLPLVVTRSKSGGAHIWCFLTHPMPAADAIKIMKDWKPKLGFDPADKKVEIFPKQASVKDMDAGSWINLPYFGGHDPFDGRVAIGPRGQSLTLEEFLRYAEIRRIAPEDLRRVGEEVEASQIAMASGGEGVDPAILEHQQAPPCVQHMLIHGVEEGGRNNALYQMGVYLTRAYPDDWQERLHQFNQDTIKPPVGYRELSRTISSMSRGYGSQRYKCEEHAHICDKTKCQTRMFGISGGKPEISKDLVRRVIEVNDIETYFIFDIGDDRQFSLTPSQMLNKTAFQAGYLAVARRIPIIPKKTDWHEYINGLLAEAEEAEPSEALSSVAVVEEVLHEWICRTPQTNATLDRVLEDGAPVYIKEEEAVFFKGPVFAGRLSKIGGIKLEPRQLLPILKRHLKIEEVRREVGSQKNVRLLRYPCPEPWFDVEATDLDDEEF